jgi:hypothetical protein
MRIFLVPFAALAMFATANYGASAMSVSQADGLRAGDQAVMAWHQAHHPGREGQIALDH